MLKNSLFSLWEKVRVGCSERIALTSILSRVKQITSSGWMHETSARGLVHWEDPEGWDGEVGGGIGMGNTCKSMADSCQCMAKPTTIL